MKVSIEDSSDLDFVIQCLMTGAIDVPELRAWCDHAIAVMDEVPDWMFELAYFDEAPFHICRIIGFVPHGSDAHPTAVAGIALKRGRDINIEVTTFAAASRALRRHPEVLQRFKQTFPFLKDV